MVKIRSSPHSKLKAEQNSAHLPGYLMKNRLETVISQQPVQWKGFSPCITKWALRARNAYLPCCYYYYYYYYYYIIA